MAKIKKSVGDISVEYDLDLDKPSEKLEWDRIHQELLNDTCEQPVNTTPVFACSPSLTEEKTNTMFTEVELSEILPPPIIQETKTPQQIFGSTVNSTMDKPDAPSLPPAFQIDNVQDVDLSQVELDDEGTPWDERIHSVGKSKTKGGVWRLKKGIDSKHAAKIIKELKNTLANGITASPTPVLPPPLPIEAVTPVLPPVAVESAFNVLLRKITENVGLKKITIEQVNQIIRVYNMASLPALQGSPHIIPAVNTEIDLVIGAK